MRVTDLPQGAGRPLWSPDGTRIAFTAPVDRDPSTGPVVVERLDFKADGLGLRRGVRRHVHVLDLASGAVRQLTDGDWDASDPAWSPDGTQLALAAATEPDADLTLASAAYVVAVAGGNPRKVGPAQGIVDGVTWVPDGRALIAIGTLTVRIGHLELLLLPLDGSAPTVLTENLDRSVRPGIGGWYGAFPSSARTAGPSCSA